MEHCFSRTELLLGKEGMARLAASHVLLFGVGGVGSHAAEALVRSGVGALTMVDGDVVAPSNLNRQLHATQQTIGKPKVEAMRERLLSIQPGCRIHGIQSFYLPEAHGDLWQQHYDFVIDAVDTVTAKIDIILTAQALGYPVISCMGTGNKLDPSRLQIAMLSETSVCPLCRVMRRELKARGAAPLLVVFSKEPPRKPVDNSKINGKIVGGEIRPAPGSTSFVPPTAGLLLAGYVVRKLSGVEQQEGS